MSFKVGDLVKYKPSPTIMGIYTRPYEIRYTNVEYKGHYFITYMDEEEMKKDWAVWK